MADLADVIEGSIWARDLTLEQRQRVRAESMLRGVAEGAFVCKRGEPVDCWIGVVEGLVKISSVSPEGKAVTFTGIPAGGWYGEGSLLKADPWKYDGMGKNLVVKGIRRSIFWNVRSCLLVWRA